MCSTRGAAGQWSSGAWLTGRARAQVEDMLKRSFAEFHAQRAAPEAREALAAGKAALAALRARPWPPSRRGTPRNEVERYWALTQRIEALDALLQVCRRLVMTTVEWRVRVIEGLT